MRIIANQPSHILMFGALKMPPLCFAQPYSYCTHWFFNNFKLDPPHILFIELCLSVLANKKFLKWESYSFVMRTVPDSYSQ